MADTQPRRTFHLRLSENGHREVARLANIETEGNVSMMARRLLAEAVEARKQRERR